MNRILNCLLLSFLVSSLCATKTEAAESAWSTGIGLSMVNFTAKRVPSGQRDADGGDNPILLTVIGGYTLTSWLDLEFDLSLTPDRVSDLVDYDSDISGISIAPKVKYKLNNKIEVHFKVGGQYYSYENNVDTFRFGVHRYSRTISSSGAGYLVGIGSQYFITENISIRLDYKYSDFKLSTGDNDITVYNLNYDEIDLSISALTCGVNYHF